MIQIRPLLLATACCLALVGCTAVNRSEPLRTATLSTAPDAKGYLIVGMADENAHNELLSSYKSFDLFFRPIGAKPGTPGGAMAQRFGCTSLAGMGQGQSCEGQSKMGYRVLEMAPGEWRISGVAEELLEGFPARQVFISADFPAGTHFTIAPGRITYIGDFLFRIDPEAQSIVLKTHTRDDAAAPQALADYPGLQTSFTYQDPAAAR